MDFGQLRLQQQESARQMMYQNSGYQFERRKRKTLILDVSDDGTNNHLTDATEFSIKLFEPLIIDKRAEIYFDSFLTHNSLVCHTSDTMAFCLKINEFNVNSNVASSTSNQQVYNNIIIPNEHNTTNDVFSCVIHKGKKLNYVCTIEPGKITKLTGKITDLAGNSMYTTSTAASGHHKIYKVQLTSGATSSVTAGQHFGWDAGASSTSVTGFVVAYSMNEGAKDLYFYSNGDTLNPTDGSALTTIDSSSGSDPASGLDGLTADVSTFREGDNPRFIAEFVIVDID